MQVLPEYDEIISHPLTAPVPKSAIAACTLIGVLSKNATKENMDLLLTYVQRMPMRFQIIYMRQVISRDVYLSHNDAFKNWAEKNVEYLLGDAGICERCIFKFNSPHYVENQDMLTKCSRRVIPKKCPLVLAWGGKAASDPQKHIVSEGA